MRRFVQAFSAWICKDLNLMSLLICCYRPALKKCGLYWIWVVCHSVCPSVIILSFHSISWEILFRILPNFVCALILTWSTLGMLHIIFRTFVQELLPLIYAEIFVSTQYLKNYLTYSHQILYMHSYWQDLAWDCYTSFFFFKFVPEFWTFI